jgi:ABC-2 type transport system permease protein
MKQFRAIVKARTMEFIRDRGTFFWNLIFPILLVAGFSIAFSGEDETLFKVGLIGGPRAEQQGEFYQLKQIDFIEYDINAPDYDKDKILQKVRLHQMDMVIDLTDEAYYLNPGSPNADLLRHLLSIDSANNLSENQVEGRAIRYVDWLVPGVIGMNMLFSCLFGVGFVIVRYRKNGVLKRMKATPVSSFTFITAQMASRFIIVILTSVVVFTGTHIFLKFLVLGSYLNLLLITAMSILCMISLGLVFAARIRSEELASGLMNIVTFPMILFSGVFFSLEGTPPFLQFFSKLFPLTHFIEGARAIMLEGDGFLAILPNLTILGGMTVVFLIVAAVLFNWD